MIWAMGGGCGRMKERDEESGRVEGREERLTRMDWMGNYWLVRGWRGKDGMKGWL